MLVAYLIDIKHMKARQLQSKEIQIFKLKWWTENNPVDSGVMLMRHMECYKGEAPNTWDCEIEKEQKQQKATLTKLRSKYVTKLLVNDINLHSNKIENEGKEFEKIPVADQRKLVKNAMDHMHRRFALMDLE